SPGRQSERRIDLSSFLFHGLGEPHPAGASLITRFEQRPGMVRWTIDVPMGVPGVPGTRVTRVTRELSLVPSARGGACRVRYTVASAESVRLVVRPLVALRDFHELVREPDLSDRYCTTRQGDLVRVELASNTEGNLGGRVNLACGVGGASFAGEAQVWRDFHYPHESRRHQEDREHLYSPGAFTGDAPAGAGLEVEIESWAGAFEDRPRTTTEESRRVADARLGGLVSPLVERVPEPERGVIGALVCAADQFVVRRRHEAGFRASIIAGYPWFSDWGRDTMISLPGLLLSTGRTREAREALEAFASLAKDGLIPNCFDNATGHAEYNTVDASLWFIHALDAYLDATDDRDALRGRCGRAAHEIIEAYRAGTRFSIAMQDDALIAAGSPDTQLTWMDARRDGVVFTPRYGKPVEVNALWVHALRCLARRDTGRAKELSALADRAARSFLEQFWSPRAEALVDVLTPEASGAWRASGETRPNQVFAASLELSPLSVAQRAGVVKRVMSLLVTPMGVRTLSPSDPGYQGRYRGSLFERDRAYHNGTAWPYLLGALAEGMLRAGGFSAEARRAAIGLLTPAAGSVLSAPAGGCVGQIAEVFDGDSTAGEAQRPGGCVAQAWSVAEVLRVWLLARGK
ncbi:MAG: glycogen debranching enzyme N-terminal domain-containing protein, partial [Phycisphaerae bacterium]|nr:glycogen debranching enzyme N-terminal domain-containing protein [Phycisphaerae bacterium]